MDDKRWRRAVKLRDAGRLEESVGEFEGMTAAAADPADRATILVVESDVLAQMGRFDEAHALADEAVRLCPARDMRCNALIAHAGAHSVEGLREQALAELDHALDEYHDVLLSETYRFLYEEVQIRRGVLLVWLKRPRDAQYVLEECREFHLSREHRSQVLCNLGRCYDDLGLDEMAAAAFSELVRMGGKPERLLAAHFGLATIHYRKSAFAKALSQFKWCEANNVGEAAIPGPTLFGWLRATYTALGNDTEAGRYDALARKASKVAGL